MKPFVALCSLAVALLPLDAHAADGPTIWALSRLAVAGWPSGAIWDNRVQIRTPLYRSKSIVFRDTFAGFGLRVAATPAFTEVGPRITFAPVDVFDVDVQAAWIGYYGMGGIGLLPFDKPGDKLDAQRAARADESTTGTALSVTVAPTLKAKVWRFIGVYGWTISYLDVRPDAEQESPYVYEPFRDLVVGWQDWTFEHQAVVLYEAMPGGSEPLLRFGPTVRDEWAAESGDRSTVVGAVAMGRPGTKWYVPTLVGQVLWYVRDADRVGPVPSVNLVVQWQFESALR